MSLECLSYMSSCSLYRWEICIEYYSTLRGILDELDAHSPLVTNLQILKRYLEDLAVSKNLSGQDPSLVTQVSGQTLGGDNVPSYLLPIPEFYRCPLDLVLMQHPFLTPSTQL